MPVRSAKTLAILSRRNKVAELYLCGHRSVRLIAAELERLGIPGSPATVTRDCAAIREEWRAAMVENFDAWRREEVAKIDRLEREAWAEWERSKTERGKVQRRTRQTADGAQVEEMTEREGRLGDPRYLERIAWCIDRRAKLLGLDAPERHELSGPGGGPVRLQRAEELSDDQLAEIAVRDAPQLPPATVAGIAMGR